MMTSSKAIIPLLVVHVVPLVARWLLDLVEVYLSILVEWIVPDQLKKFELDNKPSGYFVLCSSLFII